MSKKFNIPKEMLYCLYYNEGLSYSEISNIIGYSIQTVSNKFKLYKWKARSYSESLKGRKILWGEKIGKSLKGRKRPGIGGAPKGRIPWNKGMSKSTHPNEIIYGCKGEKHWNWKGGISSLNIRLRQSSYYKLWRSKIFQRDDYTCQKCHKRGNFIVAHHKKKFSIILLENNVMTFSDAYNCKILWKINNGITMCQKCHKEEHTNEN